MSENDTVDISALALPSVVGAEAARARRDRGRQAKKKTHEEVVLFAK
jgi:hypothetical protein